MAQCNILSFFFSRRLVETCEGFLGYSSVAGPLPKKAVFFACGTIIECGSSAKGDLIGRQPPNSSISIVHPSYQVIEFRGGGVTTKVPGRSKRISTLSFAFGKWDIAYVNLVVDSFICTCSEDAKGFLPISMKLI
ncbi:hypothetical protein OROHE_026291 [Orobanche hederae]